MQTRATRSSSWNRGVTGAAIGLLFLPALGCSGEGGDPAPAIAAGAGVAQAWEALIAESEGPVADSWSERTGTPRTVYGALSAPLPSVSERDARGYFASRAALFRMRGDLDDLALSGDTSSPLGRHFSFRQHYEGVPVHGADVKIHFNDEGRVIALHSEYVPELALDTVEPRLDAQAAIEAARAVLPEDDGGEAGEPPESELTVLTSDEGAALAYRVVLTGGGGESWQTFIDAGSGEPIGAPRDINRYVNGTGQVYVVNAIVATHNNALVDGNDSAAAVPAGAYTTVTLQGLTGTGYLDGQYASSADSSNRAFSGANSFIYNRQSTAFSETMGYYYLDYAERYIQSLGFANVNNRQQVFAANKYKKDNSFYTPGTKKISYGTGGVDDAEDAEVILHEYGHSIQDNQVPGFGSSAQGGAMGEGFGDYWAATVGAQFSGGFQDTCVAEWDAVSYSSTNPPCLRRVDGAKHYPENYVGQVHSDGEIWSAALWQIRSAIGAALADKVVLQAHFLVPANGTFSDGSNALVTAAINLGYSAANVSTIRTILQNRGFTVTA
jgi:Zn-dependent metalloprotease